jgi:predicted membrane protein
MFRGEQKNTLKQTKTTLPTNIQIALRWGTAYGVVWSLAPGILSELMRQPGQAATVIFAGAITGVLVACALTPALTRSRMWQALLLGLLSLPLGAGLFGFTISWIQCVVMNLTGVHYRFVMQIVEAPGYVFAPLKAGRDFALYSTLSPFGLLFIPLAVLTTLHLRSRILRSRQPAQS